MVVCVILKLNYLLKSVIVTNSIYFTTDLYIFQNVFDIAVLLAYRKTKFAFLS